MHHLRKEITDHHVSYFCILIITYLSWFLLNLCVVFKAMAKNNLPHLTESTEQSRPQREVLNVKETVPKPSRVMIEVREWWKEQLAYSSESSEDEV